MNSRKLLLSTKNTPFGFKYHERKVPEMDKSGKKRGEKRDVKYETDEGDVKYDTS